MDRRKSPTHAAMVFGKIPPQAIELEKAVLAVMMHEADKLETILDIIHTHEIFYVDAHQKIYKAVVDLYRAGRAIDMLTVTEQVTKNGDLEYVGGAYGITEISRGIVSGAHVVDHCLFIMEKYMQRELIRISADAMTEAYQDTADIFELLDKTESAVHKVAEVRIKKKAVRVKDGLTQVLRKMNDLRTSKARITGINTGFSVLNEITGGWQPTDLIIIGARPSVGKTVFAINTALACALDSVTGGPVAIFSLEMGQDQVIQRMLACISAVQSDKILRPADQTAEDIQRINDAAKVLGQAKVLIDDTPGLNVLELRSKARKLQSKDGIKLLIVDYLQLMTSVLGSKENREQQIAYISRELKKLAKDLHIPIIALSQLSREMVKQNRGADLADLRESGSIEQDADLVLLLSKPTEVLLKKKPEVAGKILGDIAKHRNGSTGVVYFTANNKIQRWTENTAFLTTGTYNPYQQNVFGNNTPGYQNTPTTTDDLPF